MYLENGLLKVQSSKIIVKDKLVDQDEEQAWKVEQL